MAYYIWKIFFCALLFMEILSATIRLYSAMLISVFNIFKGLLLLLFSLLSIVIGKADTTSNNKLISPHYHIRQTVKIRMEILKKLASIDTSINNNCSRSKYIIITEYQFGRSGNNLIEFTHLLWLSKVFDATFIPPTWMLDVFTPFNTTLLQSVHCIQWTG